MKSRFHFLNLFLVFVFLLIPVVAVYSQNTGTSPQSGTSSQTEVQNPSQGTTTLGETQTAPPQPALGNTAPSAAARSVAWGWLILGFGIGLVVGAVAWRRPAVAEVREDIRRDRIA